MAKTNSTPTVWKMNLIDNRRKYRIPTNLKQSKFEYCYNKNIIGIGWAKGYDSAEENNYRTARERIQKFQINDIVLTRNPVTKEYYACKITKKAISTECNIKTKHDIHIYCKCKYKKIGTIDDFPIKYDYHQLFSRRTICQSHIAPLNNYLASLF